MLFPQAETASYHIQNLNNQQQLIVDAVAIQQTAANQAYNSNNNGNSLDYHDENTFTTSTGTTPSNWIDALLVASANVTSRGGERSSVDIERAIESLLFAKRRRQAFDTFEKDKDVPLKPEIYDQLLRTFVSDRDHIFAILGAMEMHGIYQQVLKSGEKSALAQAIFEALSIHDFERAMSAFNQHHLRSAAAKQQQKQQSYHISSSSSIPVYSGLLAALVRRGMKSEANSIIIALSETESEKDVATGLIRCLHNEVNTSLTSSSSSTKNNNNSGETQDAESIVIEFTRNWLLAEEKKKKARNLSNEHQQNQQKQIDFLLQKSLEKSNIGLHGKVACAVFAQHPNPFTCAALSRFLLQHYGDGCAPILSTAI